MKEKKILIIRACGAGDEKKECDNIKLQSELYDIEVNDICPKTNEELETAIKKEEKYDFIYLSSHGDANGFGNESGTVDYSWFDFGVLLCESECMNEDCIVMLSCCRGGLNQVAYDLFYCCQNISYIVGPRQNLYGHDLLIAYNILLYNYVHRKVDPIVACEKIKHGTDLRFICFDRLETEGDLGYISHINQYSDEEKEAANEAKEKAGETEVPVQETK